MLCRKAVALSRTSIRHIRGGRQLGLLTRTPNIKTLTATLSVACTYPQSQVQCSWRFANSRCVSTTPDTLDLSLNYRVTTLADYEDIMAIGRDLFDGLDYLPATYHMLTNDPTWKGMCVTVDGKIIGFNGAHVVDNGRSIIFRGTRFREEFRGKSAMKRVVAAHRELILADFPSLESACSTIKSDSRLASSDYWRSRYNLAFNRKCVAYKFPRGCKRPNPSLTPHVHDIDKSTMSTIFSSHASTHLFPDGFINPRYVFLKPMPENIDLLYRLAHRRFASFSPSGDCDALTLGVHFPCTAGYVYHVECHGGTSPDNLAPHMYRHIEAAFDATSTTDDPRDLYFFVYGRHQDSDFAWLDEFMRARNAQTYPLSYYSYIGVRNPMSQVTGQ